MRTRFDRSMHPHVVIARDQVGRAQMFPRASAGAAVARFECVRRALAALDLIPIDSAAMPLACLIAFEVVCERSSLSLAYTSAGSMRQWRGQPFIDWATTDRGLCRRYLSPLTAIAIAAQPDLPPLPAAMLALRDALAANGLCRTSDDPVACAAALQADAGAWAVHYLPGYLASHLMGIAPLACVPRSALAREESRLALAAAKESDVPAPDSVDAWTGDAVAPLRPRNASDLRRALRDVLAIEQGVSEHVQRRRVLARLDHLRASTSIRELPLRLVLDFASDLIARGTPQT
ncbi:MAG: hypothetical protein N3D71_08450, partial [Burkholderiaceae bacterium]|nr:hypothetical protein [Burkholderiaceae bacterium]